jgi:hypothetical protein
MLHGARQPANVFLMENKAMLGDFGIARVLEDSLAVAMTQVRRLGPTPRRALRWRRSAGGVARRAEGRVLYFTCGSGCVRARACVRVPVCAGARARRGDLPRKEGYPLKWDRTAQNLGAAGRQIWREGAPCCMPRGTHHTTRHDMWHTTRTERTTTFKIQRLGTGTFRSGRHTT